jgi:hypothetical protein
MADGATKSSFKITYILTGVSLLVLVVCYFYSAWATTRREEAQKPRLALASLVKALRQYEHQAGRFPIDFIELEQKVWRHKDAPDFGAQNRRLSVANYYYMYYPVDGQTSTIWALPSGPKREDGATVFVVLTPEAIRTWKGPALEQNDLFQLRPVPDAQSLAVLGLTEQRIIEEHKSAKSTTR